MIQIDALEDDFKKSQPNASGLTSINEKISNTKNDLISKISQNKSSEIIKAYQGKEFKDEQSIEKNSSLPNLRDRIRKNRKIFKSPNVSIKDSDHLDEKKNETEVKNIVNVVAKGFLSKFPILAKFQNNNKLLQDSTKYKKAESLYLNKPLFNEETSKNNMQKIRENSLKKNDFEEQGMLLTEAPQDHQHIQRKITKDHS